MDYFSKNKKATHMKKLIKLIPILGACILIFACTNDKNSTILPQVKQNVSFKLDIQPILTQYCAGCHSPMMNIPHDLREGVAYESLKAVGNIKPGNADDSEPIRDHPTLSLP